MSHRIVQGYIPGAIGRIAELHGVYYAQHAGFGAYFEAKVARELSDFVQRYDARRDGLWLALADGQVQASVALDASAAADDAAHLRWFIASERTRGSGVGTLLLQAALEFCRTQGYRRVRLWTFAGLHAARHLYEKHGFRLVQEQWGDQWGSRVNEQCFEWNAGERHE